MKWEKRNTQHGIPPSHADLNKLLGVLVKLLQDGKGLLRKTVLEDPLDHTTAIGMCRQRKNLCSKTGKHRQQRQLVCAKPGNLQELNEHMVFFPEDCG